MLPGKKGLCLGSECVSSVPGVGAQGNEHFVLPTSVSLRQGRTSTRCYCYVDENAYQDVGMLPFCGVLLI